MLTMMRRNVLKSGGTSKKSRPPVPSTLNANKALTSHANVIVLVKENKIM